MGYEKEGICPWFHGRTIDGRCSAPSLNDQLDNMNRFHELPCICSVIDYRRQNVVRTEKVAYEAIAECVTVIFTTLWGLLWSINYWTYTHGNMSVYLFSMPIKKHFLFVYWRLTAFNFFYKKLSVLALVICPEPRPDFFLQSCKMSSTKFSKLSREEVFSDDVIRV